LARRDVPVFPLAAVGHLDAVSLLDADRDAVRRACPDRVDAIPEDRLGLPVRMDEAVGKLAVREPRLADAVRAHPDSALAVFPGLPAWVALAERWARRRAAVELYIPDEAPSAA
jgi:hypothetical protein